MPSHRSLLAWKEARYVSLAVVKAAKLYWKPWASPLFAQLLRCAPSVQVNIAEGAAFGPSPTYTRHLSIAYGSAIETIEFIELLIDSGTLPQDFGRDLLAHAWKSRQLLVGLLKSHRPFLPGRNRVS
jgi:four helix bundle protein